MRVPRWPVGWRPSTEEESEGLQLPDTDDERSLRSKEVLRDEVLQPPIGNGLGSDDHPDLVDALLPGRRHTAVYPLEDLGKVLVVHFFAGATDENTPSRVASPRSEGV
jgi:hypothetical protein